MRLLSSLFTAKISSTHIGLGEPAQFVQNCTRTARQQGRDMRKCAGERKALMSLSGKEENKAERRRASKRQYRGAVLRASGKRVESRILWTLHGETTTVTKQTPETKRGRQENKTSMN